MDRVEVSSYFLLLCAALISTVFSWNEPSSPYNFSSNVWNNQNTNQNWLNSGQAITTPWPALGRPYQQNYNSGGAWTQNGQTWAQNTLNTNQNAGGWVHNGQWPIQYNPTQQGTLNQNPVWIQNGSSWIRGTPEQSDYSKSIPSSGPSDDNSSARKGQTSVLDNELREFSQTLLDADANNAAEFLTVNYQGKTSSGSSQDNAPQRLLNINNNAYNIPTIAKLMVLHNNYILETHMKEDVNSQEINEENAFLDALVSTPVMSLTRDFLVKKGKLGNGRDELKNVLKEIWFTLYPRGGRKTGSSGFEHVFLAELKNREVSGLHNWIYFSDAEAKNNANYLGYLKILDLGNKGSILKYHFTFHDIDKPVGSMFIGTSPELELALYTTCFLLRADHVCPLRLSGRNFIIRTYTYTYHGKKLIGSAFPEI